MFMSAFTNSIQVTACDNELYLIAINPNDQGSAELLHYVSGYNQPVNVTIYPGAVLPTGTYTLVAVGINWGAQANFIIQIYTNGTLSNTLTASNPNSQPGVWTATATLAVTQAT
jgi:hypothetical protein